MTLRAGFHGTVGQPSAQVIDGSLFLLGTSKSQKLNRTPSSAGNTRIWTFSCWMKKPKNEDGQDQILVAGTGPAVRTQFYMTGDVLAFYHTESPEGTNSFTANSSNKLRDVNSWYHLLLQCNISSGYIKCYANGKLEFENTSVTTSYITQYNKTHLHTIGNHSFNDYNNPLDAQFSNVYFIDGAALEPDSFGFTDPLTNTWRPKKFDIRAQLAKNPNDGTTWSNSLTTNAGDNFDGSGAKTKAFDGNGSSKAYTANDSDGTTQGTSYLEMVFPSAISGALRVKCDNGNTVRNTTGGGDVLLATQSTGSDNKFVDCGTVSGLTNLRVLMSGGSRPAISIIELDGYVFVDGLSGDNSFYLPMDNDDFNIDKSGKGNNWTPVNFSGTSVDPDVIKDSPSGAVSGRSPTSGITTTNFPPSNYATLNPLDVDGSDGTHVLANGNLEANTFATNYSTLVSTIAFDPSDPNGFYFESTGTNSAQYAGVGVAEAGTISGITGSPGRDGNAKQMLIRSDGYWYYNTGGIVASGKTTWTSSDVIGCAFKNNKIWVSKNGVYIESGDPVTEANPNLTWDPANHTNDKVNFIVSAYTSNPTVTVNFGQKPFKYAPPDGFQALNLANIRPETVITRPDQFVGVVLYDGNASTQSVSGLGFKPDIVWVKRRNGSGNHNIQDSVRGAEYFIQSDDDMAQSNSGSRLSSFDDNGFTLTSDNGANNSSGTYVGWSWKAGGKDGSNAFNVDDVGYASAAAAGLTGGSITPSGASVGTKQGFSIVKWTRGSSTDTIPHGLSQAPDMIIQKSTSAEKRWSVGFNVLGWDKRMYLERTNEAEDSSSFGWSGNQGPTDTLLRTGGTTYVDGDMIAYCWHNVPGLQKFGSYTGNGNTSDDGPFIELGFRPAIIWFKRTEDDGYNWNCYDTTRSNTGNPTNEVLRLNLPDTEEVNYGNGDIDVLSNGFKIRNYWANVNADGKSYIYCAWAEAPTVNLYGGQSNAR